MNLRQGLEGYTLEEMFLFERGWVHLVQERKWEKDKISPVSLNRALQIENDPELFKKLSQPKPQPKPADPIPPNELRVQIYSKPDSQGRQSFYLQWWSEDWQENRGQCYFAVLSEQLALGRKTPVYLNHKGEWSPKP